jgi:hypothetical protein
VRDLPVFDRGALFSTLDARRRDRGPTDMDLAMRIAQWLGQSAAAFIHPAQW